MELQLVIDKPKLATVRIEDLDPLNHYIGVENEGGRWALRRSEFMEGKFRWAATDAFCSGNGLTHGDADTLKDAISKALDGTSFASKTPAKIVVFTTARELFLWLAGEEVK